MHVCACACAVLVGLQGKMGADFISFFPSNILSLSLSLSLSLVLSLYLSV